jgi:hypothetical protein
VFLLSDPCYGGSEQRDIRQALRLQCKTEVSVPTRDVISVSLITWDSVWPPVSKLECGDTIKQIVNDLTNKQTKNPTRDEKATNVYHSLPFFEATMCVTVLRRHDDETERKRRHLKRGLKEWQGTAI